MSYTYTAERWAGSTGIFVVEFEFAGAIRRYCSASQGESISVSDGSNTIEIPWGIADLRYTESIDITSPDTVEDNVVSMLLITPLQLMTLWSRGITLEGVRASVYLLLQRTDGTIQQTWDNKVKLYTGIIQNPEFGDPDEVEGFVRFSIEQEPFDANRLLLEQNFIDSRFSDRDIDTSDGKVFPIVIGDPGRNVLDAAGNQKNIPAFPMYCYDRSSGSGNNANFLFAGHKVGATTLIATDQNSESEASTISYQADAYNRGYSYVPYNGNASGIAVPGGAGSQSSQEWWCYFSSTGGGIANPYRSGEALDRAGDVLRWAMNLTGQTVDDGAFANVSNILNRYKIEGYINDPTITAWDWVAGNLLPLLPVSIRTGPEGLKPVFNSLQTLDQVKEIASIEIGIDKPSQQTSAVQTIRATSDIYNDLSLNWGKNGLNQSYTQVSRCRNIAVDPQDIESSYAQLSVSRYGTKPINIETDYVYDRQTAELITKDLLRANCLPIYEVEIQMPIYYGYLQIGDVLKVSSSFLNLTDHKMIITSKTWGIKQKNWLYKLQFELNPIQNLRSS